MQGYIILIGVEDSMNAFRFQATSHLTVQEVVLQVGRPWFRLLLTFWPEPTVKSCCQVDKYISTR